MATLIIIFNCQCTIVSSVSAQAKKPRLMVVPSDVWCNENGYTMKFDNNGTEEIVPDYKRAIQSSRDLMNVISKINILMADKGFPLQDLSQTTKSMQTVAAENSALRTKTTGAALYESPADQLRRVAKADIILEIDWGVNTRGPKRSITYNLRGLDAYSNKQVAGAEGTGAPSFSAELPILLEEAVQNNMDNFTAQLQQHFDDLLTNGREVIIELQVPDSDTWQDFETEYGGVELSEIIDRWMEENTVEHRFNKSEATENHLLYDQVRIPVYKPNGMPMDAEAFARQLRNYLKAAPYQITCKVVNRGLGRCLIVVGEK
ncbi:MAG: hypothetical protein J6W24_00150 [Prevotella sp.]|nr:hypothetical protein [Prevotella sp.]